MPDNIYETPSTTPNFRTELAARLADLVPEAIADGKVDVEKLKELLDGDSADGHERFGLFWPGKKRALRAAQEPTTATLKPDFENSKDWDTTKNIFIEGDNLEVLKILQKHYHAKIKMIYIDPPYNTGKDFVYPDNYKEGLDTYLEWTRQVNEEGKKLSTNAETEGRYHSNWLNMMYPRLKLARNLLTDDGVIFISIDDNEQDNLRRLCSEVFGEGNFVAQLVWEKKKKGSFLSNDITNVKEYILVYAKYRQNFLGLVGEINSAEETYPCINATNKRELRTIPVGIHSKYKDKDYILEKGTEISDTTMSIVLHSDLVVKNGRLAQELVIEGNWRYSQEAMHEYAIKNEIYITRDLYLRRIVKEPRHKTLKDLLPREGDETATGRINLNHLFASGWGSNEDADEELRLLFGIQKIMDYPKPVRLLQKLFASYRDSSVTVLDFFAGSSTAAHAVMQLNAEDGGNRRFIMVQLPEPMPDDTEARKAGFSTIADFSRKRIELAGEKIKADNPLTTENLDTGFRAYKLTDTNFSKWRVSSDIEMDALQQHLFDLRSSSSADDATFDSLLTEILLKQGYSLTEAIIPVEIAGLELRTVGEGTVLAYLNEHAKPTLEQLRAVVDADPQRIIVLEDAFQGDDELKTNLAQLTKSKGIELWTA